MTADVISLSSHRRLGPTPTARQARQAKNMHNLLFRSRKAILEADEALLFEDVCYDLNKAARKLEAARLQLKKVQEHAAAEVQELTAVTAKLGAAVVAALLPSRRGRS